MGQGQLVLSGPAQNNISFALFIPPFFRRLCMAFISHVWNRVHIGEGSGLPSTQQGQQVICKLVTRNISQNILHQSVSFLSYVSMPEECEPMHIGEGSGLAGSSYAGSLSGKTSRSQLRGDDHQLQATSRAHTKQSRWGDCCCFFS